MVLHMSASVHAGIPAPHPPGAGTPNGAGTPWSKHPPGTGTPWDQQPPRPGTSPRPGMPPEQTPPPQQQAPTLHMFAIYYRLQRSCEGYVFTHVCPSTGGSASVHAGIPPSHPPRSRHSPWSRHPQSRHPSPCSRPLPGSRHPPEQAPIPWSSHPLEQATPEQAPIPLEQPPPDQAPPPDQVRPRSRHSPGSRHPPPSTADGYCCGRYACYWNAFLFFDLFHWLFKLFFSFSFWCGPNYYNFLEKVSLLVNYVSFATKIFNIFKFNWKCFCPGEGRKGKVHVSWGLKC